MHAVVHLSPVYGPFETTDTNQSGLTSKEPFIRVLLSLLYHSFECSGLDFAACAAARYAFNTLTIFNVSA